MRRNLNTEIKAAVAVDRLYALRPVNAARILDDAAGEMPTTSVLRLSSGLSRSNGLFDQIFDQIFD
jgi:hypothetical protein